MPDKTHKTPDPFSYDKSGNARIFSLQFILVLGVSFCIRMCIQMQNTALPLFIQDVLHGTTGTAGALVSTFMLSALIARLFIGGLVDKRGRKPIILLGIGIYTATAFLFGLVTSIPMLFALRAIQGIGFAGLTTAISTAVTDMTPEDRLSEGIGYYGLTQSLTQAVGPMAIIWIIGAWGYTHIFSIFTVFGVLAFIVASTINVEKYRVAKLQMRAEAQDGLLAQAAQAQYSSGFLRFVSRFIEPRSVLPALCACFFGIASTSVMTFLPSYGLQLGIDGIGLFFTIQAITVAASRLFAGKISRRFGAAKIIIPSIICMGGSLIAISFAATLPAFIAIAAIYGLSFGALQPEINSLTIICAPFERRGIASSTYFSFLDLGNAIGASLWGFMSDLVGLRFVFALSALSLILLMMIYLKVTMGQKAVAASA